MTLRISLLALALSAAALLLACGASGAGSCHLVSVGYCEHYTGSAYTQGGVGANLGSVLQSTCQSAKGTWSGGGCPGGDATGRCIMAKGTLNEIVVTYYSTKYADTAAAQKACSSGVGGNAPGGGEFQSP